jgi:hypothetical protein
MMCWPPAGTTSITRATVLTTGTISFMMDCGDRHRADIAREVQAACGGGMLKIVNQTVPLAPPRSATTSRRRSILAYIGEHDTSKVRRT